MKLTMFTSSHDDVNTAGYQHTIRAWPSNFPTDFTDSNVFTVTIEPCTLTGTSVNSQVAHLG